MITKTVAVTHYVDVQVDETKFTEEFMSNYREYMYEFDSIDDHIRYLARLAVEGYVDEFDKSDKFIEGYGPQHEFGISALMYCGGSDYIEE
jgi:hypothetical protein